MDFVILPWFVYLVNFPQHKITGLQEAVSSPARLLPLASPRVSAVRFPDFWLELHACVGGEVGRALGLQPAWGGSVPLSSD